MEAGEIAEPKLQIPGSGNTADTLQRFLASKSPPRESKVLADYSSQAAIRLITLPGGEKVVYKDAKPGNSQAIWNEYDFLSNLSSALKGSPSQDCFPEVYAKSEGNGNYGFYMEYLDGYSSLAQRADLSAYEVCQITSKAMTALHEAMKKGFFQKDFQLANVMWKKTVDSQGRRSLDVKLIDFGISDQLSASATLEEQHQYTTVSIRRIMEELKGLTPFRDPKTLESLDRIISLPKIDSVSLGLAVGEIKRLTQDALFKEFLETHPLSDDIKLLINRQSGLWQGLTIPKLDSAVALYQEMRTDGKTANHRSLGLPNGVLDGPFVSILSGKDKLVVLKGLFQTLEDLHKLGYRVRGVNFGDITLPTQGIKRGLPLDKTQGYLSGVEKITKSDSDADRITSLAELKSLALDSLGFLTVGSNDNDIPRHSYKLLRDIAYGSYDGTDTQVVLEVLKIAMESDSSHQSVTPARKDTTGLGRLKGLSHNQKGLLIHQVATDMRENHTMSFIRNPLPQLDFEFDAKINRVQFRGSPTSMQIAVLSSQKDTPQLMWDEVNSLADLIFSIYDGTDVSAKNIEWAYRVKRNMFASSDEALSALTSNSILQIQTKLQ